MLVRRLVARPVALALALAKLTTLQNLATMTLMTLRRPTPTALAPPTVLFLCLMRILETLALMLVRMATTCAEPRPQSGTWTRQLRVVDRPVQPYQARTDNAHYVITAKKRPGTTTPP